MSDPDADVEECKQYNVEVDQLRARVVELEGVLAPFAAVAEYYNKQQIASDKAIIHIQEWDTNTGKGCEYKLIVGHLRAAKTATEGRGV